MNFWNLNPQVWYFPNELNNGMQTQQFWPRNMPIQTQFTMINQMGYLQNAEEFDNNPNLVLVQSPKQSKSSNIKRKDNQLKENDEFIKVSRNIKSLIIKEFVKFLKKDASKLLLLKQRMGSSYPIKNFMEKICSKIPADKEKYIKVKTIHELCFDHDNEEFAIIMRTILHTFLKNDFQIQILNKKKNKAQYLKGAKQLYSKLFEQEAKKSKR